MSEINWRFISSSTWMFHPFISRFSPSRPSTATSTPSPNTLKALKAPPSVSTAIPVLHIDDHSVPVQLDVAKHARSVSDPQSSAQDMNKIEQNIAQSQTEASSSQSTALSALKGLPMQHSTSTPVPPPKRDVTSPPRSVGSQRESRHFPSQIVYPALPRPRTKSAVLHSSSNASPPIHIPGITSQYRHQAVNSVSARTATMLSVPDFRSSWATEHHGNTAEVTSPRALDYEVDDYGFLTDGSISDNPSVSTSRSKDRNVSLLTVDTGNLSQAQHSDAIETRPRRLSQRLSWFWNDSIMPSSPRLDGYPSTPTTDDQILEKKWSDLMKKCPDPADCRSSRRIRRAVRDQGLPPTLRGQVWQYLTNAALHKSYHPPDYFSSLVSRERIDDVYTSIERDVARTYPNHVQFLASHGGDGQEDLLRVLKAYAQYNPKIGYCQGMGRVAGMLLMHMDAESSFWVLVALTMTPNDWLYGLYADYLQHLRVDALVFARLVRAHLPKIANHLEANDVDPLMFITPWFLTMFTQALPWPTVLRVWDLFMCAGRKILFRVALGLMDLIRSNLFAVTDSEILGVLLHLPKDQCTVVNVMNACYRIRVRRSELDRCKRIVLAEQEAMKRRTRDSMEKQRHEVANTTANDNGSSVVFDSVLNEPVSRRQR